MRKVPIAAAGLIVLLIGGAVALIASFDANRYKPQLIDLGRSLSGRAFDIRGDIQLKPSLTPTLIVEGVTLGNAKWATHATMLDVARFEARIRLLALLHNRVEITRLVLVGANLVLETDRKGLGNWAFAPVKRTESRPSDDSLPLFDLDHAAIRDSVIEYRADDDEAVRLQVVRLDLDPQGLGQPLTLSAELRFQQHELDVDAELAPLRRLFANEPFDFETRITTADLRFEGKGTIAEPLTGNGAKFNFEITAPAPDFLASTATAEGPRLGAVQATGQLHASDERYKISALHLELGRSVLDASVEIDGRGDRPDVTLEFHAPYLEARIATDDVKAAPRPTRLFSTTRLPFEHLKNFDLHLSATVAELHSNGPLLESVRVAAEVEDGDLAMERFDATIGPGTLRSTLSIDADRDTPSVRQSLLLDNVPIAALSSEISAGPIRGGRLDADIAIKSEGWSLAELAGNGNGHARLAIRDAEFDSGAAGAATGDLLMQALEKLNPGSGGDRGDVIECAVFNFPLSGGRAESATGIGIRTRNLNILGGGSIDLRTERIDLGIDPKPRQGLGINVAALADFVRIGGTLSEPVPSTDTVGVATAGLKTGAAIATGGLSLLAEGLLDRARADADVCGIASGTAELPSGTATATSVLDDAADKTSTVVKRAGEAVKGTFKRLFGN